jgi:16S rRNA (cytosine967-C5)-methyltransferase
LFVRPIGITPDEAIDKLAQKNIVAQQLADAPHALKIAAGGVAETLAAIPCIVQDPAAGLVVQYASLNGVIADLCAAPGGKAIAMADTLTEGYVFASDLSAQRMQRLTDNIQRIGNLRVVVAVGDARHPAVAACDGVLIDAPCTGTGTLRRHPDGKWRLTQDDLRALTRLQADVLDAAATIVRPGGTLVYSTCSIEDEENVQQVQAFIERQNGAFRLAPPSDWTHATQLNEDGMLVVLPHVHGFDGAFAARMERVR